MKQNDSLIQEALALTRIGCWEWDLQANHLICTGEVYLLFGLEASATVSGYQPLLALVHEKDRPGILQAFGQALQDKRLASVDFCITRPDGVECILEVSGRVREDENGQASSLIGTVEDISVRKQAEKDLLKQEQQYHFIAEAVPAMIWTGYADDDRDYVNAWMVKYTGLPAEKLLGKGWLTVVHPDDRQAVLVAQANPLQVLEPYQVEVRFRRADGQYRWHIMHALPFTDDDGSLLKWIGINADIHEQKLKEEALRENEVLREMQQKLRTEKELCDHILDNSINGLMAFDCHGQITKWNQHMEFLSGRKREEVLGRPLLELFPDYADREEGKAIVQALKGEKVTLRKHPNPFGTEEGLYEINLMPLQIEGEIVGGIGAIYKLTEIIKLEEEQANLKLGQQKEVLNAILRAQERERERISESLHNGIGQLLFAAKLNLHIITTRLLQPETQAILAKVTDLLNEAIKQSRTVSYELVPIILKDFGLQATLEDLTKMLSSPALTIDLQGRGVDGRLEKFMELTVFRVIQALLSNVMEHSQATQATVKLSTDEEGVLIRVVDNGKGFDPTTATASVKEGNLQTISNRVTLLNGKLTIDSVLGKGTTVEISLPAPQQG